MSFLSLDTFCDWLETLPWDPNSKGSTWPNGASAGPLFSPHGYWTSLDTCAEAMAISVPKH